jgi:hypothetical protein
MYGCVLAWTDKKWWALGAEETEVEETEVEETEVEETEVEETEVEETTDVGRVTVIRRIRKESVDLSKWGIAVT